jgi:hypothetical protein
MECVKQAVAAGPVGAGQPENGQKRTGLGIDGL